MLSPGQRALTFQGRAPGTTSLLLPIIPDCSSKGGQRPWDLRTLFLAILPSILHDLATVLSSQKCPKNPVPPTEPLVPEGMEVVPANHLLTQGQLLPHLCTSSQPGMLCPHPEKCHSSFPGSSSQGHFLQGALAISIGLRSTCSSCSWGLNEPPASFLLPQVPQVFRLPVPGKMSSQTCRAQEPLLTILPGRDSTAPCSPSEGCLTMSSVPMHSV